MYAFLTILMFLKSDYSDRQALEGLVVVIIMVVVFFIAYLVVAVKDKKEKQLAELVASELYHEEQKLEAERRLRAPELLIRLEAARTDYQRTISEISSLVSVNYQTSSCGRCLSNQWVVLTFDHQDPRGLQIQCVKCDKKKWIRLRKNLMTVAEIETDVLSEKILRAETLRKMCSDLYYSVKGGWGSLSGQFLPYENMPFRIHFTVTSEVSVSGSLSDKSNERPSISQDLRDKVWRRDNGKCVQCGSQKNLEFDHIIPFSKGGSNTYRNLQLLCEACNRSKSDKIG